MKPTFRTPRAPRLRLSPLAWAKLSFLRDIGPTEIGGFGISDRRDLLLVTDVRLVRQSCDWASVSLDDEAVADFFDEQVDQGRSPAEFGRIWLHTHPGTSAKPSFTDEQTFARVFGHCEWSVMFILARGGQTYARLKFAVGAGGEFEIPVEVDWSVEFAGSEWAAWQNEYAACVFEIVQAAAPAGPVDEIWDDVWGDAWPDDVGLAIAPRIGEPLHGITK